VAPYQRRANNVIDDSLTEKQQLCFEECKKEYGNKTEGEFVDCLILGQESRYHGLKKLTQDLGNAKELKV